MHVVAVFEMHWPRMEPFVVVRCPSVVDMFPADVMVTIVFGRFHNAVLFPCVVVFLFASKRIHKHVFQIRSRLGLIEVI